MEVLWDDDAHTMVRLSVKQSWTVDDYWYGSDEADRLMDTVNRTVHLIIDLRKSRGIPNGFLPAMRRHQSRIHPNMGIVVIVGAGALLTTTFRLVTKLFPRKEWPVYMVSTLDEAHDILLTN